MKRLLLLACGLSILTACQSGREKDIAGVKVHVGDPTDLAIRVDAISTRKHGHPIILPGEKVEYRFESDKPVEFTLETKGRTIVPKIETTGQSGSFVVGEKDTPYAYFGFKAKSDATVKLHIE